jgi:hypothetical protein
MKVIVERSRKVKAHAERNLSRGIQREEFKLEPPISLVMLDPQTFANWRLACPAYTLTTRKLKPGRLLR